MCTKTEAKEAVKEVLEEHDEEGMTIIEREIQAVGDKIIRKITFRLGWPLLVAVIAGSGMWFTLQNRVSNLEMMAAEGGRYTQDEHNTYADEQKRINDSQDKAIADFRLDVKDQLGQVNAKLDSINTLLIQIARN